MKKSNTATCVIITDDMPDQRISEFCPFL